MTRESFEGIVRTLPDEILLTDESLNELIVLARAADEDAERAKAGLDNDLGRTMARYLVRFTELVGPSDIADRMVATIREALDDNDQRPAG